MPEQQPLDELDELRGFARTLGTEGVEWETPPPELWDRISAEAFPRSAEPTAPVVALAARRRRPNVRWLIGAAAALVVVITAAAVWTRSADDVTVLSSTELEPLGDSGQGSAEIVDHDGSLQLRLATTGIEPTDGFTEVWLINPDVTELISLGPIRTDGVYDLPTGLDPAAFPIVDISSERFDGNPQHSGDSILRGQFAF